MFDARLWQKYNIPAPRYTVYPQIPYWQEKPPAESEWMEQVRRAFAANPELSVYIHLPFCEKAYAYCGSNKRITGDHSVEAPYVEALLKEWSLYKAMFSSAPILQEVHLGGATPSFFSPAHLEYLLEQILADSRIPSDREFSFEAHPGLTTRAHLEVLHRLGFRRMSIGLHEVAPELLEIVQDPGSLEPHISLTRMARETGFDCISYDVVYGLPLQTPERLKVLLDVVGALQPERISYYSYARTPWVKSSQRMYSETYLPDGVRQQELYLQGRTQLEDMGYREIGLDHFCRPKDSLYQAMEMGALHRNFLGYTPHYTQLSIGLGASAISDSWSAFVQNARTIESYQDSIEQGLIPILRGHLLSEEDQILRRHLLNILCRLETSWDLPHFTCPALEQGLRRLAPLAQDGLVELFPCRLRVPEKGRPFLRLICLMLDARYPHPK